MEEKDESEQSISAGRQEIRKRRQPSQPMVDKSQQTEVTEKKKQLSIPQSSGPKAEEDGTSPPELTMNRTRALDGAVSFWQAYQQERRPKASSPLAQGPQAPHLGQTYPTP